MKLKRDIVRKILDGERISMRNIKGYASAFVFFIIRLNVTDGIIRKYIIYIVLCDAYIFCELSM